MIAARARCRRRSKDAGPVAQARPLWQQAQTTMVDTLGQGQLDTLNGAALADRSGAYLIIAGQTRAHTRSRRTTDSRWGRRGWLNGFAFAFLPFALFLGYRRRDLFTLLGAAGFRSTPGVLIVPLQQEFGWNRATISLAVSINLILFGLAALCRRPLRALWVGRVVVSPCLVAAGSRSRSSCGLPGNWTSSGASWPAPVPG